jgi:hypothetical protein
MTIKLCLFRMTTVGVNTYHDKPICMIITRKIHGAEEVLIEIENELLLGLSSSVQF